MSPGRRPFQNETELKQIKYIQNEVQSDNHRIKNITVNVEDAPQENLENKVTNMIHEIGIPAHIKGYHYLRDAIIMAVEDMDVFNAIT